MPTCSDAKQLEAPFFFLNVLFNIPQTAVQSEFKWTQCHHPTSKRSSTRWQKGQLTCGFIHPYNGFMFREKGVEPSAFLSQLTRQDKKKKSCHEANLCIVDNTAAGLLLACHTAEEDTSFYCIWHGLSETKQRHVLSHHTFTIRPRLDWNVTSWGLPQCTSSACTRRVQRAPKKDANYLLVWMSCL